MRRLQAPGIIVVVAALCAPALAAEDAAPGDSSGVAQAERRAAEAFEAYSRKDYPTAVSLYMQAYEAAPSGAILYNVARIYDMKLGNRAQAVDFYRRYAAHPDARGELVEIATRRVRELRDEAAAAPAVAPPAAAADKREPDAPVASRAPAEPEPRRAWSTTRKAGVALAAAGLVGVGVGGGFGLAALSSARTAHDLCDGNVCTSQRGVDAAAAGRRAATISNVGFAAGGALLAAGAAMFFLGADRGEESGAGAAGAGVHVEAAVTASGSSLLLAGRW